MSRKIVTGGLVALLGIGGANNGCNACYNSDQTREIATADYVLENYRWFKNQSAAIDQVASQISSTKEEIADYQSDFKDIPRAEWPFDAREELARKEAVLRGYISQHNMLVKDYNARSSDVTRKFTEGSEPKELELYLKEYDLITK